MPGWGIAAAGYPWGIAPKAFTGGLLRRSGSHGGGKRRQGRAVPVAHRRRGLKVRRVGSALHHGRVSSRVGKRAGNGSP